MNDNKGFTVLPVGMILQNGATVILSRESAPGELVVLANSHGEFVTWRADSSGAGTYSGNYHGEDVAKAVRDFLYR